MNNMVLIGVNCMIYLLIKVLIVVENKYEIDIIIHYSQVLIIINGQNKKIIKY